MAVTKNTWNKGLNSDLSKLKSQPDSYLDAKNIRVITDLGTSTFAIENIRGTEYSFRIPKVEKTYAIDFTGQTTPVTINISRTVAGSTVQVNISILFDPNITLSNEDIAIIINEQIQSNSTTLSIRDYVRAYFNSDEIVIYDFLPPNQTNWSSISISGVTTTIRSKETVNHTILGWGYYNDNLVLITCDEDSNSIEPENDPGNTDGFIWDIKFNNQTNEPVNLIGNTILPYDPITGEFTLKYAGALSLSRYYAINKHLKCRYESTEKTRVAWTDWHNNLRICNIADPQIWATPPGLFSYIPAHIPQKPVVKDIIQGGSKLVTGKYQYFYLLASNQGAESTISVVSNLLNLYTGSGLKYDDPGQVLGTVVGKSVLINISDLDTNYDTIRIGYVIYQVPDFAEAFWIDEIALPDDGNVTYVHNGNENEIPITDISTLANLNRSPEIFKTIDVVRNRLIAANAITKYFDLTDKFDSRAFRYKNNSFSDLYNSDDIYNSPSVRINRNPGGGNYASITLNGVTTTYLNKPTFYNALIQLPDIYDYINPFNIESNDLTFNKFSGLGPGAGDWNLNCQFKFKEDGTTIGGEGPNISYEFITQTNVADTRAFSKQSTFIRPDINNIKDYDAVINGQLVPGFNDTKKYPGGDGKYLDTHKSPLFETLFTGYSRGEVYRWGIVFYDLYGYPSYPQWIADIKFPFASDNNGNFGLTNTVNVNTLITSYPKTQWVDGNNIPSVSGTNNFGNIDLTASLGGIYTFEVIKRPDNTKYTWNPGFGDTLQDFVNNFNGTNLTLNDFCNNQIPVKAEKDPNSDNIRFIALTNNFNDICDTSFYIERTGLSNIEISTNFVFTPQYSNLSNDVVTKQLGIKFKLDTLTDQFKKIKNQISGWSYVRVKRDLIDSTRLGTGVLMPTLCNRGWNYAHPIPLYVNREIKNSDKDSRSYWFVYGKGDVSNDSSNNQVNSDTFLTAANYETAIQSFFSPNFLNRQVPDFSTNDYIRFIGRTYDTLGLVQYASMIDGLQFNPVSNNYEGFYVSSNYIDYTYSDGNPNTPVDGKGTVTLANDKRALSNRAYIPVYRNTNSFPLSNFGFTGTGVLQTYRNVTDSSYASLNKSRYGEWGTEHELLHFKKPNGHVHFSQWENPNTVTPLINRGYNGDNTLYLGLHFVSYETVLIKQYGGWTRSARYGNEYILANHFVPYSSTIKTQAVNQPVIENAVFGGDTYVNYFDLQKSNVNFEGGSGFGTPDLFNSGPNQQFQNQKAYSVGLFFPCETRFNTELNTVKIHASTKTTDASITYSANYIYNPAYSQQNTTNIFLSKAYLQTNVKEEPHTIYASDPKLDNDQNDAWRKLLINNALSVNGNYGEINRVIQFKDKLYFYQNDAVGIAAIDERVLADEQSLGTSTQTQLGTGTVLQRYDYLSTETGSKHSFAVAASGSAIYHYDAFINKFFKLTYDDKGLGMIPLTDIEGLSGFFRNTFFNSKLKSIDKILYKKTLTPGTGRIGITSEFNSEYNSVYFTFFDESDEDYTKNIKYTISFNEMLDAFESFYDFYPSMYLNMRKRFLSVDYRSVPQSQRNNQVYIHNIGTRNNFYNQIFPSTIKFRVNENSDYVKTFDNLHINSEVFNSITNQDIAETVNSLSLLNDYQIYDSITSSQGFSPIRKIRTWRFAVPRDETNPLLTIKPRFADKYIDVEFTYDSTVSPILGVDKVFRLHDVITEYSLRSKILPK